MLNILFQSACPRIVSTSYQVSQTDSKKEIFITWLLFGSCEGKNIVLLNHREIYLYSFPEKLYSVLIVVACYLTRQCFIIIYYAPLTETPLREDALSPSELLRIGTVYPGL